ncbi:MAG: MATE family efflux transporter [Planctomycetaceae bacterium]
MEHAQESSDPQRSPEPPRAATDPDSFSGTLRELLRVAVPLIVSSGSQSLMHVTDRIFLTRSSVDAVAASLPAGVLFWAILSLPFGTAVYTNTFVAQYTGAGKPERVAAALWQGVRFAILCGLLLACCGPFASQLLSWTGHSGRVAQIEVQYFSICCYGGLPALLSIVCSSFFSGRGRTIVVMWVNMGAAALNAVLAYLLIFGVGPFPEYGIAGAAWATNIANCCTCTLFAGLAGYAMLQEGYPLWQSWRFDRELTLRMLRYGLPTGVQYLVDVGAFLLFTVLIGRLGTSELAATTIAFNLNSLAFVPMFGLGTAVLTVVGRRMGERRIDAAARTTWCAFAVASAYMGVFIVLYLALPHLMLLPYASDDPAKLAEFEKVRPLVVHLLRFVALYSYFDAMAIVFGSAIRGAGDSRFSLLWTFAASWTLMVLPAWLVVRYGSGQLLHCWWAVSVYIMVLGVGFLLRFRTGRWRTMSVIERDSSEAAALPG